MGQLFGLVILHRPPILSSQKAHRASNLLVQGFCLFCCEQGSCKNVMRHDFVPLWNVLLHELALTQSRANNFSKQMRQNWDTECNEMDWTQGEGLPSYGDVEWCFSGGMFHLRGGSVGNSIATMGLSETAIKTNGLKTKKSSNLVDADVRPNFFQTICFSRHVRSDHGSSSSKGREKHGHVFVDSSDHDTMRLPGPRKLLPTFKHR